MAKLGVNIDHVATLRQVRGTRYPDLIAAAVLAEEAGADQITVHLREDRRHIQDADVSLLRRTVQTELNLEMAVTDEMIEIASRLKPHSVTFVPERRKELTTEGGLDVVRLQKKLHRAVPVLQKCGVRVSLFIDPEKKQVEAARETNADAIEIHTGKYAEAVVQGASVELRNIRESAEQATSLGLWVAAGHGLHYENTQALVRIQEIREFNIGHAVIARALFVGIGQAVREMKAIVQEG